MEREGDPSALIGKGKRDPKPQQQISSISLLPPLLLPRLLLLHRRLARDGKIGLLSCRIGGAVVVVVRIFILEDFV